MALLDGDSGGGEELGKSRGGGVRSSSCDVTSAFKLPFSHNFNGTQIYSMASTDIAKTYDI